MKSKSQKKTPWNIFVEHIYRLNSSKFFTGLVMLTLNIGSKYITLELSTSQEEYIKYTLGRQILVFAILWMGTRDIYMSLIITLIFVALADYAFNEESKFCMLPSSYKNYDHLLDEDKDGEISQEELEKAKEILKNYEDKKKKADKKKALARFYYSKF